jgi:hypothetical protein
MTRAILDNLIKKATKAFERSAPHEALEYLNKALKIAPGHPLILLRTGIALHLMKRFGDAENFYIRAISAAPSSSEAHNNLGKLYLETGKNRAAAEAFRDAASLMPGSPFPQAAMATALVRSKMFSEAEDVCKNLIYRFPDFAEAHHTLALLLLLRGNYHQGWKEYEWRWETNRPPFRKRSFPFPRWTGESVPGKRLLVHAEQGLGDTIQFSRYLTMVADVSNADLTVECHPSLHVLFSDNHPEICFRSPSQYDSRFDYHIPLLSLPLLFNTTVENIPNPVKYLHSSISCRTVWSERIDPGNKQLKAGVCWNGNQYPDPGRSCPFEYFRTLLECKDIAFYSLQLENNVSSVRSGIADLTSHLHDFAHTAAVIEQLDLVITIDTAVAHLAGSLGKPTWVMLPYVPDWRWGLEGETTPWYKTMRLFRQTESAAWKNLCSSVTEALLTGIK